MANERGEPGEAADTGELLQLIDRLEALLEGSQVAELEIEVGETALVLRTPQAITGGVAASAGPGGGGGAALEQRATAETPAPGPEQEGPALHAILAPLTGIFYTAPAPGAQPYVRVGGDVNVGQVIGLIEAMKLFNEIKSDVAGRVTRMAAESGTLVKAKQPLIEVEPR
ncbi:MAG: acetyl-CoA carboxylase biotin carboxyl carrier protein [Chloroflexota bacterium]|nr:acetyl-CoA carboxylase biotin carboxyl carrier protein [Chloroflexota bacterium]